MKFTKMQGAGNDFVIIDDRSGAIGESAYSALAAEVCRRRLSIGADGMMVVLPAENGGDYAMRFYNSDGSLGEMCGNGARCIARYGHDRGLAGDIQRIETTAGIVVGQRIEDDLYCVRLNDPTAVEAEVGIPWEDSILSVSYIELGDPGIPHAVLELPRWDEMPQGELRELGDYIRHYPAFPKGANVTFRKIVGEDHVKAVTFERGVEDFTLACGTGAGATAVGMFLRGEMHGDALQLDFPGGELQVSLCSEGRKVTDIYLTGPAVVVAEGEYIGK